MALTVQRWLWYYVLVVRVQVLDFYLELGGARSNLLMLIKINREVSTLYPKLKQVFWNIFRWLWSSLAWGNFFEGEDLFYLLFIAIADHILEIRVKHLKVTFLLNLFAWLQVIW